MYKPWWIAVTLQAKNVLLQKQNVGHYEMASTKLHARKPGTGGTIQVTFKMIVEGPQHICFLSNVNSHKSRPGLVNVKKYLNFDCILWVTGITEATGTPTKTTSRAIQEKCNIHT